MDYNSILVWESIPTKTKEGNKHKIFYSKKRFSIVRKINDTPNTN